MAQNTTPSTGEYDVVYIRAAAVEVVFVREGRVGAMMSNGLGRRKGRRERRRRRRRVGDGGGGGRRIERRRHGGYGGG